MAHGGARSRSGPAPDPTSERSERRGLTLTALPREGFTGEAPEFPLPTMRRFRWEFEDKRKFQVFDAEATKALSGREREIWADVWTTPQACAWALEPWRRQSIAEFCRLKAVVEQEPDATAALVAHLHRYRDQIGLTPAGLKENGWAIAADEIGAKREQRKPAARRLRAASDGGA
jgi:hypothetical protein